MKLECPLCHSTRIEARNYAKKTGSAVGALAGAITGIYSVLNPVKILANGFSVSGIATAIISGLVASAAGASAGAALGDLIDRNTLNNCYCHECGHCFNAAQHTSPPFVDQSYFTTEHEYMD